jgi:LppX_LprAFG lipoprotein
MRRFLLPFVVLLALVAAACGSSGSSSTEGSPSSAPAAQAVASAGQKSSDAGSARASFTATFTGATSGTMTGEGEFSQREGHLTLDMSDLGGGAFGNGAAELTFSDLVYYMKLPQGAGLPLPPGKEWFKIDLKEIGQTQGLDLEQLTQLSQSDPSQALDFLQGASDDFHAVGKEDVRGESTTHYAGTIDLNKVAENAPADLAEQYKKLAELAPSPTVPMDVWIGDDGYTHKLRFEQKLAAGSSMTMEEELYDWGTDVNVTVPPDDEVVDLTQLLGQS